MSAPARSPSARAFGEEPHLSEDLARSDLADDSADLHRFPEDLTAPLNDDVRGAAGLASPGESSLPPGTVRVGNHPPRRMKSSTARWASVALAWRASGSLRQRLHRDRAEVARHVAMGRDLLVAGRRRDEPGPGRPSSSPGRAGRPVKIS